MDIMGKAPEHKTGGKQPTILAVALLQVSEGCLKVHEYLKRSRRNKHQHMQKNQDYIAMCSPGFDS